MALKAHFLPAPVEYTAAELRELLLAVMAKTSPLVVRDGPLSGLKVSDGPSGMQVVVAPGQAMISGYLFTNDANYTVTLPAGGASTRTDIIVAQIQDQEAGDAASQPVLTYVQGTTVAEPAVPPRSVRLAAVTVLAGANTLSGSNIADRRLFTGLQGGVIAVPGALAGSTSNLLDGQLVWDANALQLALVDGATWRRFLRSDEIDSKIAAVQPGRLLVTSKDEEQTITSAQQAQWIAVGMTSTDRSMGGSWDTPSGYTKIPMDGVYDVGAWCTYAADPDGRRGLAITKGTGSAVVSDITPANPVGSTVKSVFATQWFAKDELVRVSVFQDSGGGLAVSDLRLSVKLAIVGS
jgi:hypothetical protein